MGLIRQQLPTLVFCGIALMVGSASGAVAGGMVTGAQIKDGTLTTKDVKDRAVRVRDLAGASRDALQGPAGPAGTQGLPGPAGPVGQAGLAGPVGPDGIRAFEVVRRSTAVPADTGAFVRAACPAGKRLVSANGWLVNSNLPVRIESDEDDAESSTPPGGSPVEDLLEVFLLCAVV